MIKSSRTIKILSLLVVLFVFIAIFVSIAEEIKLTTILPSQDVLRVRRGIVGNIPGSSYNYTDEPLTEDWLFVGGRVGIGTQYLSLPSPLSEVKLRVEDGDVLISGLTWGSGTGITRLFLGDGQNLIRTQENVGMRLGSVMGIQFNAPETTERMRITTAGRVGINTTNPSYTLDVSGTIRATDFRSGDGTQGLESRTVIISGHTLRFKDGLLVEYTQ